MSNEKEKIEEVQNKISISDLREAHKDSINDMLLTAGKATNGVSDKQQALTEAMAALAICFARDALYRREDFRLLMDEALSKHTSNCPLASPDGAWNGINRRGRDGRDGRDALSVGGKWGKVSVPAALGAAALVTVWMVVIIATVWKAKGWA
jgi:hypothetical protein